MPVAAALFDLDGTLVDSLADIAGAMNTALVEAGWPPHPEPSYRTLVGTGAVQLVAGAAPRASEAQREALLLRYRAHYAEQMLHHTRPFPGVASLLQVLAREQVRLGVLSNKLHAPTQALVKALLNEVPWGAVWGERPGIPRKPDPAAALALASALGVAPAACAFVGDTAVDMATARSAGMWAVGVSWGFRGQEELWAAGAQGVVSTAEELLAKLLSGVPV